MTIQVGDRIPPAMLGVMGENGPVQRSTEEFFAHRKVVLFAVPGAFTPTCSARHLPGFIELRESFYRLGIDAIACVSVNDVFVMDAWGKNAAAQDILMLADGNGELTRALGLELDATAFGMGFRSQRFALVADNGVVTHLFVEKPGEFRVSGAEFVLGQLETVS
jgi:peroxiredoxin